MTRRRSRLAGEAIYRATARTLQRNAAESAARSALRALLLEVEQFHAHTYPGCTGGCPAHEAMALARAALEGRSHG